MDTQIGAVNVRFRAEKDQGSAGWTAEWECLTCGARGHAGADDPQNTEEGAYSAARVQAERHVAEDHANPG